MNARTQFNALFTYEEDVDTDPDELDANKLDALEESQ
jgi:hypothetical protein